MTSDPVPLLETAEEATEQLEDVPMAASESVPLLETPLTTRSVRPFCLDDVQMFDDLQRRHVWLEEQLHKQQRLNRLLREQLRAQRDRSTSLERSASACRQRKALGDITNQQETNRPRRLDAARDLLITLDAGITFKAREALKRSFAGNGLDVWASTRAVKRVKKELGEGATFEWTGEDQTRAFVCTDVRLLIERRLQSLVDSGRFRDHPQFFSKIVLVLTGDKGGDGAASTTKIGIVLGNIDHPNSPRNLSILGIFFGNDDRQNMGKRLGTVFRQLNELNTVSFVIAGLRRTVPVQLLLCADLKFTSALLGHQGAAAKFPCSLCTARKDQLSDKVVDARPTPPTPTPARNGHSLDLPPSSCA